MLPGLERVLEINFELDLGKIASEMAALVV